MAKTGGAVLFCFHAWFRHVKSEEPVSSPCGVASWIWTLPGEVILGDISKASESETLLEYCQNWLCLSPLCPLQGRSLPGGQLFAPQPVQPAKFLFFLFGEQ